MLELFPSMILLKKNTKNVMKKYNILFFVTIVYIDIPHIKVLDTLQVGTQAI